jgi:hypothetical protein
MVQAKFFTAPGFNNDYQFGFVEMSCAAEAECAHNALQASPGGPASSGHFSCASPGMRVYLPWQAAEISAFPLH